MSATVPYFRPCFPVLLVNAVFCINYVTLFSNAGTFSIRLNVQVIEGCPNVTINCIYAPNSRAQGCCVKSTTQSNLEPLIIYQNTSSNVTFGPFEHGSHQLVVAEDCSFSQFMDKINININTSKGE